MTDNVAITAGAGTTILADELTDATLGTGKAQFVKIMNGVLDSSTKLGIYAEDAAHASGDTGLLFLAVRNDAGAALAGATGDYIPLSTDSSGALRVTGGGGGTQYTEDDAAAANPTGTAPILVRADTPATVASTNGDNVAQRGTNYGAAYVQIVTSAGAFVDSFGGAGGTSMADDAAFTVGTTNFTPAGGTYRSVRDAVNDNDGGAFAMTASRALYVALETPNADSAMDDTNDCVKTSLVTAIPAGANAIGKLASNSGVDIGDVDILSVTPGVAATNLGKAEDAAHASGDTGVAIWAVRKDTAAALAGTDGDYAPLEVDANGRLHVVNSSGALIVVGGGTEATALRVTIASDSTGVLSVDDNSGSLTVDGTVAISSLPASTNTIEVVGDVAHDAPAAGNPVLVGAYAVNAEPAAVANADAARLITDLFGKLITLPYANPENFLAGKTAAITDTTRTAVIAAQGAGVRIYATHVIVTNSHATVGTVVKIEDGTSEIYNGYAAALGGGFSVTLPVPLRLTANTALNVSCVTTGASVYASASGYKGA